ncbi:hypothetical protein D3C80_1157560 [compost metagenome]
MVARLPVARPCSPKRCKRMAPNLENGPCCAPMAASWWPTCWLPPCWMNRVCGLATWPSALMSPSGVGYTRRWRRATGCWKSSVPRCRGAFTSIAWMPAAIRAFPMPAKACTTSTKWTCSNCARMPRWCSSASTPMTWTACAARCVTRPSTWRPGARNTGCACRVPACAGSVAKRRQRWGSKAAPCGMAT